MVALAAIAVFGAYADENAGAVPEGTQKIILKISTVETVMTRTRKTWNPPAMPMTVQELPYTEQEIAKATPEEATKMAKENRV